jgi:hypothetical protein
VQAMKEKKIGVSKVVIQMGDKEATLTVEQAKELRDALNALLGEKIVERVIETRDVWYPYQPYIYKRYDGTAVSAIPTWTYGTTIGTYAGGETFTITMGDSNGDPLPV